jgi:hypothetical protein
MPLGSLSLSTPSSESNAQKSSWWIALANSSKQFLVQGHLVSGALISYHLRGGAAFGGNEGLVR